MIIELRVSNWLSFRDEVTFSLVATAEKRLKKRLPKVSGNPLVRVSPVAALYGGNASGKTNFFRLIAFLKLLVVQPLHDERASIPVEGFALFADDEAMRPTEISLTFLTADETIYTLELSLTRECVLTEKLSVHRRSGLQEIYVRYKQDIHFPLVSIKQDKAAQAYSQVVSGNQLFLGLAGSRVPVLQEPWRWFCQQLTLISTHSAFSGYSAMFAKQPTDIQTLATLLKELDTGICQLEMEETALTTMPVKLNEQDLLSQLDEGQSTEFNFSGLRYIVSREQGQLRVKKMVSYHQDSDGCKRKFDLRQESEGTLRLLDILPAFMELERQASRAIYVIDELDCSWHYALSRRLLGIFLSRCSEETRTQLIFSTHDLMLMDQELFRRDELWITERQLDGSSALRSLADYQIRYDKDIRKLYLQGALGGMPQLACFGSLSKE